MRVLKFGGTSVGTPAALETVLAIIGDSATEGPVTVVVSALGGVTDQLLAAIEDARSGGEKWTTIIDGIERRHRDAHARFLDEAARAATGTELAERLGAVRERLRGVSLLGECSPRLSDAIVSCGEYLSTGLLTAALLHRGRRAWRIDPATLIRTDDRHGDAVVDRPATERRIRAVIGDPGEGEITVTGGFIGAAPDGAVTTLGRGGSDYSAALIGAALAAERVEIWTDVDGVYTADPGWVAEARPLAAISYDEAERLAQLGAKVLHPRTMLPLAERRIPIAIRNTLRPAAPGTVVDERGGEGRGRIRAISAIQHLVEARLEYGAHRAASRLQRRFFDLLDRIELPLLTVQQSPGESGLRLLTGREHAAALETAVRKEFGDDGDDVRLTVSPHTLAVVAAIGAGADGRAVADLTRTLSRHRIESHTLTVGSGTPHPALVVAQDDVRRAVQVLHALSLGERTTVNLLLAGPTGTVGTALLARLPATIAWLGERGIDLRIVAAINSRRMFLDEAGLSPATVAEALAERGKAADWERMTGWLEGGSAVHYLLVDTTASKTVARRYLPLLERGVGVVTANKIANTMDTIFYHRLRQAALGSGAPFHYETNVAAATPVIAAVRNLRLSGDRLRRIEGLLSGTLAYVFARLQEGVPFSTAVREARDRGLTEPHPGDDLSGLDVARKLLILAREAGWELDLNRIAVTGLTPGGVDGGADPETFLTALETIDGMWAARVAEARERGEVWTYLAVFDGRRATVGPVAVPADHPAARVSGTDNVVVLHSERFSAAPYAIQGPGAGPELTAAGVLADVVEAVRDLTDLVALPNGRLLNATTDTDSDHDDTIPACGNG